MSDDDEDDGTRDQRALKILTQALREVGIEQRNTTNLPLTFFGETVARWQESHGYIEVEFYSSRMFSGNIVCTIGLSSFAERTAQLFPDDAEALKTLVALIQYLKSVVSGILPSTSQNLFARRHNLTRRKLSAQQRKTIKALESELVDSIDVKSIEKKRDWEREFRAETEGRGGSAARLGANERQSLHRQYDDTYKIVKGIKKDYDKLLATFTETHKRSGHKWKQWHVFWNKYATELYGQQPEFLALFAEQDKPSASEIVYRWLARQKGHEVSYLKRLVYKSRRS